jgi:hypothetical protein
MLRCLIERARLLARLVLVDHGSTTGRIKIQERNVDELRLFDATVADGFVTQISRGMR